MWPVGLLTSFGISTPIVKNGAVKGFYDGFISNRKYPVDFAGFAVSVERLLKVRHEKARHVLLRHAAGE